MHRLDLTGEVCPFTFVRTKLALEALPIGDTLEVIVDNLPASKNVPRSCAEWGQEIVSVTPSIAPDAERWAIAITKRRA